MEEDKFIELAKNAKVASKKMAVLPVGLKNSALLNIAKKLKENKDKIFEANKMDLDAAKSLVENGTLSQSTFNRLKLDENKMRDMIQGLLDISKLPNVDIGLTVPNKNLSKVSGIVKLTQ